jgi:predicted RNase H-like HicB family nuclease
LPGCFSEGETLEEAKANAAEAIQCHIEGLIKDGGPIFTDFERSPEIHKLEVGCNVNYL